MKPVWVLLSKVMYDQVISFAEQTQHRGKYWTVKVERRILWGEGKSYRERLKGAGLSGRINTACVERVPDALTITALYQNLALNVPPLLRVPATQPWNVRSGPMALSIKRA